MLQRCWYLGRAKHKQDIETRGPCGYINKLLRGMKSGKVGSLDFERLGYGHNVSKELSPGCITEGYWVGIDKYSDRNYLFPTVMMIILCRLRNYS
jgi:hypothetical protein